MWPVEYKYNIKSLTFLNCVDVLEGKKGCQILTDYIKLAITTGHCIEDQWLHTKLCIYRVTLCIKFDSNSVYQTISAFAWNDVLPITLGLWHVRWDERKSCDWLYILTVQGFLPFLECPTTTLETHNSSLWNAARRGSPGALALIFKIPREILGTPTLTPKFRARGAVFKVRGPATDSFEAVGGGRGGGVEGQIWLFSLSGCLELPFFSHCWAESCW